MIITPTRVGTESGSLTLTLPTHHPEPERDREVNVPERKRRFLLTPTRVGNEYTRVLLLRCSIGQRPINLILEPERDRKVHGTKAMHETKSLSLIPTLRWDSRLTFTYYVYLRLTF